MSKEISTTFKRKTLEHMFPSGYINGMPIGEMSTRQIAAVYGSLSKSGSDMTKRYIPKHSRPINGQMCLFDALPV